jgi:hypothetical protein
MLQLAATPLNGEFGNVRMPEVEEPGLMDEILNSIQDTLEDATLTVGLNEDDEPEEGSFCKSWKRSLKISGTPDSGGLILR